MDIMQISCARVLKDALVRTKGLLTNSFIEEWKKRSSLIAFSINDSFSFTILIYTALDICPL